MRPYQRTVQHLASHERKQNKMTSNVSKFLFSEQHCENLPMQFTEIYRDYFSAVKIETFIRIFRYIFLNFAQNIDCGYTLEPPRRGRSNEYPQSMFWGKNKKKYVYPYIPQFYCIKVGIRGYLFNGLVFLVKHYENMPI